MDNNGDNKYNFLPEELEKKLTHHAKNSLARAFLLGQETSSKKIENIHLFYSIYLEENSLGSIILKDLGLKREFFKNYFKKNISDKIGLKTKRLISDKLSPQLKKVLVKAYATARNTNYGYVGTEHLVYALLEIKNKDIQNLLAKTKMKKMHQKTSELANLNKILRENRLLQSSLSSSSFFSQDFMEMVSDFIPHSPAFDNGLPKISFKQRNSSPVKSKSPFVDKFCVNINEKAAKEKEIVIGREKEIERVINILGRKNKNNPILVGHPGVGKTALVMGLSQIIDSNQIPAFLFGKKIMSLDIAALIAGTSFRGEFESRLKEVINEVSQNKDIILFIDEIHNIVGAGNVAGNLDLANIIKPALAQGDIRLIGATTFSEYKKYIEKDSALERRFQPVPVKEPSLEETEKILWGIKNHYEDFHNVSIDRSIIKLAVELSQRYITSRYFPDKAIDVIDETASKIRSQNKLSDTTIKIKLLKDSQRKLFWQKEKLINEENYEKAIQLRQQEKDLEKKINLLKNSRQHSVKKPKVKISPQDIFKTVALISGVPEEKLSLAKSGKIKNISRLLTQRIIGQNQAIKKITNALLRSQSGLENTDRPLGSFLFMGPTGVGKTLTAKTLAQDFFSKNSPLIRIDMSEFMERHNVASLIGSPAGYVGYGEGGRLTEKVRRHPYSVVLFDEIEKAHPDIFNILLQILEDGILTDAEGLEINFRNTIIILTTNLGTQNFTHTAKIGFENGFSQDVFKKFENIKENSLKELERKVKPEILNRLDNILVFNPLGKDSLKKISLWEIKQLKEKLKKQNIALEVSKNALNFIAQKSLAINQGARLVRKNIREILENPIAEMIVYDKIKDHKIEVDVHNGKVKFQ